jgi:hypothetical protein
MIQQQSCYILKHYPCQTTTTKVKQPSRKKKKEKKKTENEGRIQTLFRKVRHHPDSFRDAL